MSTEDFFFLSILLFPAETAPVHDIHRFCRLLYRYARRDTASGVKRFHWPSYKKAIDQHALSDVSYSRYTTARTDAPAASVQDIAVYAADVLAGQTGPIVDVGSLAHIMLERRLFNFEAARNARWASFLKTPAEHCVASGWELRVVLVLPPEVAASPTEFACVVSTIRVEAAVGPDQTAWVSLEDGMVEEPAVTVDVMHCSVSKLSQQLEHLQVPEEGFHAHTTLRQHRRYLHMKPRDVVDQPHHLSRTTPKPSHPTLYICRGRAPEVASLHDRSPTIAMCIRATMAK